MKQSKFLAKLLIRLVLILLLAAIISLLQYPNALKNLGYIKLQWQLIFPVLLIGGFMGLLIAAAVKKFDQAELNWLLIVNTIMVIIYGMAIFVRVVYPVSHTTP